VQRPKLLTETPMPKLLALALLALSLAGGVAVGAALMPQPAQACYGNGCG
jgi:hypothetical protein